MKALVTGGGGFLGGEIVRLLRERGDDVRSFSRRGHSALDALGVEQVHGDLADADAVAAAAHGCDIVFHVAAKTGVWGRWGGYYTANVVGTKNVLAACRKHGIPRLVFTSSPSVTFAGKDQNGVNESEPYPALYLAHYPHTKALAEQEVLAANGPELATVALRPHLIWGPGDPNLIPQLVGRARSGRLRRIGNGTNLVDTTYVENAAIAHLQAADLLAPGSPVAGRAYYLSQGEPQPLWKFADRILGCAGLPPVTRGVSTRLAYAAAVAIERIHRLLPFIGDPPITRFVVRQLSTAHWFDLTAAKRDFGYVPKISTEEGLRRIAEWFKRSPA
ncbi:MAG TPA: NAD-dependent epimerase/dehydratase family protein [Gemmataceae bacterium]|nr:NAD-dependent epimerase/dehydratase family protein [Gemmataceae bacterium]